MNYLNNVIAYVTHTIIHICTDTKVHREALEQFYAYTFSLDMCDKNKCINGVIMYPYTHICDTVKFEPGSTIY